MTVHTAEWPTCRCGASLTCPAGAQYEIERVNNYLREYGIEYPLGVRGVRDVVIQLSGHLEEVEAELEETKALLEEALRDRAG